MRPLRNRQDIFGRRYAETYEGLFCERPSADCIALWQAEGRYERAYRRIGRRTNNPPLRLP